PAERMLKQLLKEGGVSNYGTYLDKTETDLIKRLKKENNPLSNKLEKVGNILEGYNKTFDTVSALAAYKALVENGVDSKQAAATTLELTNFRKTGSKMRGIKALYMFSQPAVMGAANLMRYLSTRKGQYRFAAYLAGMTALYTVLRSMDDEDEGGNKMDQLGDITRFIPFPLGDGYYFKFPVGFGMPQMAWNFATNIVKGAVGDISLTEAGTNMLAHSLKTFAPISPSEISAAKYPMEKAALTITPTLLQPLMQNVVNRSAFGNKITTNYVRDDKLKAEQSKATTAQFWKDVAINLNDTMGIDMHPEQIKNLFDGYSSIFGSLKELSTIFVENPNREALGRKTKMPFVNQFIGTTNEFSIQSRYYEASEEARKVATEYESRKNRGALDGWLDDDKRKLIRFYEQDKNTTQTMRSEKAKLTRALRSGKISAIAYENGIKRYNKDMSRVQAKMLRKYRIMEGLNTN
ncbi:TPA: LPD38 domain-containing protein, partial [Haemophilus influenzae]